MKRTFCTLVLRSRQGQLLGIHFLMPCLKLFSDVECLKFSGTNAQILAPNVDIGYTHIYTHIYIYTHTYIYTHIYHI